MRTGDKRAGDTATPCADGTCSYAATNDKSGAGNEVISRKRSATKEIGRAAWRATIAVYGNRRETPDLARSRRSAEHSSFDFVQAVCGFAGLVGVRYRSLCFQRFSFQHFSFIHSPISPPSNLRHLLCQGFLLRQGFGGQDGGRDGGQEGYDRQASPPQWLFQESPAETKLPEAFI